MGLVNYKTGEYGERTFNIPSTVKEHWGIEFKSFEDLIGLKLKDRKDATHTVKISGASWRMGIMCVHFGNKGFLALDHAIEQFEPVNKK